MSHNQEIISKSDFISHLLMSGSHTSHFLFLVFFSKGLCKFLYFMTKEDLFVEDMGGDKVRYELDNLNNFKNDPLVWNFCVEGGVVDFLDCLKGHDEHLLAAFASS